MEKFTDLLIKWLSEEDFDQKENEEVEKNPACDSVSSADISVVTEKPAAVVETLAQDSAADEEIEIYSATLAQIEQCHNYGGLTAQYLLKVCNFGYYDKFFDKYKIGYDKEEHAATFALDDSTVYKIPFDKNNAAPLDDSQAQKVLQKLNLLLIF